MNPKVSIIILNWNGWEDTIECLESLYRITYPNYDVIVVDNDSKNESVQKIREYCEGEIEVESKFFEYSSGNNPIKIIEYTREEAEAGGGKERGIVDLPSNGKMIIIKNEKNYGFTEGNNIAIRYALKALNPDYVLLLNNDTVVDKDFLGELVKVGVSDPSIGFAGPKIYYYNYKGKMYTGLYKGRRDVIQFAGAKQNIWKFEPSHIGVGEIDLGQHDVNREVDYIHGSCMLARTEMIEEIGLLDHEFFSYREENDWGIRGYKNGWKSIYIYKAKIWHKGGGSTKTGKPKLLAIYYMVRNRFLFMKKHANAWQLLSFLVYFFGFQFWFRTEL